MKLTDLLKVDSKKEEVTSEATQVKADAPVSDTALLDAWKAFAETRKSQQADYQLLSQPFEREGERIVVPLANPIQETMLNEFKTELNTFLRERLQNSKILVVGELRVTDEKKMIYTNRDKFDFLATKNPAIKNLKDRLGLDPDF